MMMMPLMMMMINLLGEAVATWLPGVITTLPTLPPASIIEPRHHHDDDDDNDGDDDDDHDHDDDDDDDKT